MENIINATEAAPAEYREAMELHTQIMQSGKMAATAMVEFARGLKRMRDERLYTALGLDTFDKYVDDVVGIGQRQAYTYIRALEQLGAPLMEERAGLGITKLEILSQVYAVDREAFLAENNVEDMSAREMRELVAKLKDTGEQLTLLQEENAQLKADLEEAEDEDVGATLEMQADRIRELEEELAAAAHASPSEKELEAARAEAEKKAMAAAEREKKAAVAAAQKQAEEKHKKALADAKAAQKKAEDELKEAKRQAEERLQQITAAAEAEKAGQAQRVAEMERRLKVAANPDTTAVAVYVDEVSGLLGKALTKIRDIKAGDKETGAKLAGAMMNVLDAVRPRFEELYMEANAV